MCTYLRWWIVHQLHDVYTCLGYVAFILPSRHLVHCSTDALLASDYDDFQAEGWKTKDLIPLMRKHETYQRACNNREVHGFEGPIKVSFGNHTYPIAQEFLRAAESQGIPTTDDLQNLVTAHGMYSTLVLMYVYL